MRYFHPGGGIDKPQKALHQQFIRISFSYDIQPAGFPMADNTLPENAKHHFCHTSYKNLLFRPADEPEYIQAILNAPAQALKTGPG
jgi:hypothetical protein